MSGRMLSEVGADGIAVISISNPPLNLLSVEVLLGLKKSIEEVLSRDSVKAIVISGSNGKFSGGFYVSAFGTRQGSKERNSLGYVSLEIITDTLEAAPKPVVAAIDGPALGAGLEVALACHARISTSSAQLGLPELRYGIIPGLGGTQRFPRLVGLSKALEMMLMSKLVNGKDAHILGLVDAVAPADELINTARHWALDILECRRPWVISLYKTDKLEPLAEARTTLQSARLQVQKQSPNLRHLFVCIDVVEEGIVSNPRQALWKEAEALHELRQSDTCRSLVHFFFAQHGVSKIPGISDLGLIPRKANKIAVVGGGLMASGIATALILNDFHVILKEVSKNLLIDGIGRVKANLQSYVRRGTMAQEKIERTLSLLKGVLSYDSFKDLDLVIEAATENVSLKQQIFSDIEKNCPQHCIFASNTSEIDLNLIGERTKSQDRIVGLHFFSPAFVTRLLEIVHTDNTDPQVIVDLLDFGKRIKKISIVHGNCFGSVVGRMFFPFSKAIMLLIEHGADVYQIDQAITKFGMSVGPLRVAFATASSNAEMYPERIYKSYLIAVLQEQSRENDNYKANPDHEIMKYIEMARSLSGVAAKPKLTKLADGDIVEMILFPIVNEVCRIQADGIVAKASDLDIASILGMGFPSYRGGIIFWANNIGPKHICSKLDEWSRMYGDFFKPCAYLAEQASKGTLLGMRAEHAKPRL